jgi:3-methylcrotonyl-CoA carboxylase alpha subunit
MAEQRFSVTAGDRTRQVQLRDGLVSVDGEELRVTTGSAAGELIVWKDVATERLFAAVVGDTRWIFHDGSAFEVSVESEGTLRRRSQHQGSLMAPMPATVVSVEARAGERVTRGSTLIVLEAMKMELPVRAPSDGIVKAVNCKPGDLVQPGVALIELE